MPLGSGKTDFKRNGVSMIQSFSSIFEIGAEADCGSQLASNCNEASDCSKGLDGPYSGPAAQLIWHSLVSIHQWHKDYHDTLFKVASVVSTILDDLENKFAPIPEPEDNTWIFFSLI
jgi:hypothetical protein